MERDYVHFLYSLQPVTEYWIPKFHLKFFEIAVLKQGYGPEDQDERSCLFQARWYTLTKHRQIRKPRGVCDYPGSSSTTRVRVGSGKKTRQASSNGLSPFFVHAIPSSHCPPMTTHDHSSWFIKQSADPSHMRDSPHSAGHRSRYGITALNLLPRTRFLSDWTNKC
ncbi:hypothetical protein EYF80_007828 [Liparis tanakae]|uniref:Uncharacterized protein n=1 Tax=Liparis tanakae TaxID=230148 RepID=A0A4Z2IVE2_9TELE|nr:hypothetical protein EYF80_007828 [Liparis tanakae]